MNDIAKKVQSAIQQVIWENPFYGCLLQEINFKVTDKVPHAALHYNKNLENFTIDLNPEYFESLESTHREKLLLHEILHFTHTHIQRFGQMQVGEQDLKCLLVAADLAINQLITGLPDEAVTLDKFNNILKKKLPALRSMEEYFSLLREIKDQEQQSGKGAGKGGEFVSENLGTQDEHPWENLSPEETQEMLKEMKNVLKRSVEKAQTYGHSTLPDNIKDLLENIDVQIKALDYKRILKNILKRSLSSTDREHTWTRPNKRYGVFSPGTKTGQLPGLDIFIDTSGSISHTEINEFLDVVSGFLKVGSKKCNLGLWHTALYYFKKYKLNSKLKENDLQSGGTDVTSVLNKINQENPNLAIILTDGYFDAGFKGKIAGEVLWVISKNGTENHPYRNKLGKTLKIAA